jgi:endoglucanase
MRTLSPLLGFLALVSAQLRGTTLLSKSSSWVTHSGLVYHGDSVFRIRGINWHGFETDCRVLHGLWAHPMDTYLDTIERLGFNAVRVPVAFEAMEDLELPVNFQCTALEPQLHPEASVRVALGMLLDRLASRGMVAVVDLHTIGGVITEAPWTDDVDEARVLAAWVRFASAFGRHPAIMGLELKNEPHGTCTTAAFHRHVRQAIEAIGDRFDGLYFVSGTTESDALPSSPGPPWGGTFETIEECDDLCRLGIPERIVFAPHVYGPDVRGPDVAHEDADVFDKRFGFLQKHAVFNQSAIVVTEFGGHLRGADLAYFERWRAYSRQRNMTAGFFWWTLPPTSGDTGGLLLDDYQTVDPCKLKFLHSFP